MRCDESTAATTAGGTVRPVLFYDFNMPPGDDGLFRVSLRDWSLWPIKVGDEIIFGCASDEVEAIGVVRDVRTKQTPEGELRWLLVEDLSYV